MSGADYVDVFFDELFNNAHKASILVMDKDGVILKSNRGVESAYGYKNEDLAGKNFKILFTREDNLKNAPVFELTNCLQQGYASDRNYVVHKDGSYIWSHGETILSGNSEGEIRLVKLIYDINEQKLLETSLISANENLATSSDEVSRVNKELIRKNEELSALNKDLDTFVYTASHDLKGPIGNIEALVNVIKEELSKEKKSDVKDELELLSASVEKFKNVIDDLSKTVQEKEQGEDRIHFTQVIEEVKLSLRDEIENSNTVFIEDFGKAPYIHFSRKNLRSVLYNVVSNGIKYRSPDRRPEIGLSTENENGYIVIKVTDNGIGMKDEEQKHVFDMYTRFQKHVEGAGIGMGIVKKIVENNGGKIEVESEQGKGSSFKIYLKQ